MVLQIKDKPVNVARAYSLKPREVEKTIPLQAED